MGNSLQAYIELLEMIAFFSGFPVLFLLVDILGNAKNAKAFFVRLKDYLPAGYAFNGILFAGYMLKKMVEGYQYNGLVYMPKSIFFTTWAFFSLLFFFRFFRDRPYIALLHSLVFFFWVAKNIFHHLIGTEGREILSNTMKLYGVSIALNIIALSFVFLLSALFSYLRGKKTSAAR